MRVDAGSPPVRHEWLRFEAAAGEEGRRLGAVLRSRFQMSRGALRRLKAENAAFVNGRPARLDSVLAAGDLVSLASAEGASPGVTPEDLPLDVIYEDEHLLVVNKASGIVVHPARRHVAGTLAAGVCFHLLRQGHSGRVRPVNRLDRETSGLVVFAKSAFVHEQLARRLGHGRAPGFAPQPKALAREYVGLARGCLAVDRGTISGAIARVADDPVRRTVIDAEPPGGSGAGADARGAVTHFQVLCRWPRAQASLVVLGLETGRTHQIRVHLAHLGHPLLGDSLYAAESADSATPVIARTALHALRLEFTHPVTGTSLSLAAPVPADFLAALSALNTLEAGLSRRRAGNL